MPSKRDAIARVPLLEGLPTDLLDEILGQCVERTYLRGETVFREGDPSRGLIVVWRGGLKVYKLGDGGREQILEIEGPGRSVAELPMFDGLPYPASCAAIEDTVVLAMSAESFRRLMAMRPALAESVIASLSRRLRHLVGLVEEISLKAVRSRLAGLLLEMAEGREEFELQLTHHDLAARIGTVREIVSRTLARMAREGAIRMDGRKLAILDPDRLR